MGLSLALGRLLGGSRIWVQKEVPTLGFVG